MSVTRFEIARRAPFAYDYERIDGRLHFAVDPTHVANQRIVDLDRAALDRDGRVQFWADFLLVQPVDPGRANRRLHCYVVNRGKPVLLYNRVTQPGPELPPPGALDPGDGFMMRHGWTIAMCGWQWDVERQPGMLGLEPPQALGPDGRPLAGKVRIAFQPNEVQAHSILSHWPLYPPPGRQWLAHQPYPAADIDEPDAELSWRPSRTGPRSLIPRNRWRFAREDRGQPVADDTSVWLEGGFQAGTWYELTYTTRICPVVGAGLLAIRDSASWLRYDTSSGNPAAGRIDFTYGEGRSQCGRFLRQFLYDGLNLDEAGRQVFDGLIPHVAGARRGEFNQRYGQPSETSPLGFGGLYPFAADELTDPVSGRTDGLLVRQRQLGGVPRIFTTNTSSEYWRSDCSLIHTDPSGTRDVEPPAEERIYLIAGHQHRAGETKLYDTTPIGARGANSFNVVDGSTLVRAFLVNLDRWVSEGIEPPPSSFPRLADGTAVPREVVLRRFDTFPGMVVLDPDALPRLPRLDLGPHASEGIGELPGQAVEPYPSFAPAVDEDGNEVVGIRLPDLRAPVGTHVGWVSRHPETGGSGELLDMMGATLPFAQTREERLLRNDPRLSIAERYRDREDYVTRARAAAELLVKDGYLLAEDLELAVRLAAERFDLLARQPADVRG
jgi:hypothetical protein